MYSGSELLGQTMTMLHEEKALIDRARNLSMETGSEVPSDYRALTVLADREL